MLQFWIWYAFLSFLGSVTFLAEAQARFDMKGSKKEGNIVVRLIVGVSCFIVFSLAFGPLFLVAVLGMYMYDFIMGKGNWEHMVDLDKDDD